MINYIALVVAILLSCVSGYYSVVGLTAIFPASFYPILIMGSVLELAKVVTSSWLYNNWNITPKLLRFYLTFAVIVLMMITSIGVFGFLSKAHLDQSFNINGNASQQIQLLEDKINNEKSIVANYDIQIQQIDSALAEMVKRGFASTAIGTAKAQKKNRDALFSKKEEHNQNIMNYKNQELQYKTQVNKLESEVGPLKYIAQLIYGSSASNDELEKAVRYVIIILISVFDPLAIMLMIAANVGLKKTMPKIVDSKKDILKIEDHIL